MDPTKCSNPVRMVKLEETLNFFKEHGVEEVYIEVADPDNICFTSAADRSLFAFCHSKDIEHRFGVKGV